LATFVELDLRVTAALLGSTDNHFSSAPTIEIEVIRAPSNAIQFPVPSEN
jgi:hypothetical protein